LRQTLPQTPEAALAATQVGSDYATLLAEMRRLVTVHGRASQEDESEAMQGVPMVRELLLLYRGLVDELCKRKDAGSEEIAVRLHQLLGASAKLREEVNEDKSGALADRLHAFTVGGERDHSLDLIAGPIFVETTREIHRLAAQSGLLKEAISVDTRRMERADSELHRMQVACENAAWLDELGSDPQRALRACLKALSLCEEGSDAQAEMRGRLYRLGQKLGLLAWDEIARAERTLAGTNPKALRQRLLYLASLWQYGAGDCVRAIDAAGQAFRLCFFPGGLPQAGKSGPPLSELVIAHPDAELIAQQRTVRAVLERIALSAPSDGEGNGKLVALLDGLTGQLNEAGAATLAVQLLLDAGQVDERRGRLAQAERRYQEALKHQGGIEQAMAALERLYRQQRRLTDLAALLERRRPLIPESAQYALLIDLAEVYREVNKIGPALAALNQAIALDDRAAAPYLLLARLYEAQRTFMRAVEAYKNAAQRAESDDKALSALLAGAQLCERKLEEPGEALELYRSALLRAYAAIAGLRGQGRLPESSPQLLADRDSAWTGAEHLLQKSKDLAGLDELLEQRLVATPTDESGVSAERTSLLKQRLALLIARREAVAEKDGGKAETGFDIPILTLVMELDRLQPGDDELLGQHEGLLRSIGQLAGARDVALLRARSAAERGVDAAVQVERWLGVSRSELLLQNFGGAETALEQALSLSPDALPVLQGLAELHRKSGNAAAEVKTLVRLSEHEPDPPRAVRAKLQAAALLKRALNDTDGARALLTRALSRLDAQKAPAAEAEVLVALFDLEREAGTGSSDASADYARRALATQAVPPEYAAELHDYLGQRALSTGQREEARQQFEAALSKKPGLLYPTRALVDLLQPTGDYARIDQLIAQALGTGEKLSTTERAELLRRQAETRQAAGQARSAFASLLAAEELSPGDVAQQVWLGDSAYELGEYAEAAHFLGGLLVYVAHPDALPTPLTGERLADALDRGAEAERTLAHPVKARALWQAALRLQPEHAAAADHYLELLLEEGQADDAGTALALLGGRAERAIAAGDVAGAVQAYTRGAELALTRLGDAKRAHGLLISAYAQIPTAANFTVSEEAVPEINVADTTEMPPVTAGTLSPEYEALQVQLLGKLLDSSRRIGDLSQAQSYAEQLAELAQEAAEKSRYLLQAAECALESGFAPAAKELLLKALRHTPGELQLLTRLSPLLDDRETVSVLESMLKAAAPAGAPNVDSGEQASQRIALWQKLAGAQLRLGESQAAAASYDAAIEAARGLGSATELSLRRAALDVVAESDTERTRTHLRALLAASPLEIELLDRLQRLETREERAGAAWRIAQVLHLLDAKREAPPAATAIPVSVRLDEAEHARWALPEARSLGDVLAALWDGVIGLKAPALDSFGVAGNDKVPGSESSPDEVARTFGTCCRVLSNQRCGMYRQGWQQHLLPKVFARMPTALIVSPALGRRPLAEVQFILARAVEGLRPEYILALCLPPRELSHLLGLAVRAFHPRHARIPAEDVAAWKRELPYRTVKRLGEVFRDQPDVVFSTVTWRRVVRRTLQRAALLVSGDLLAAASVLRTIDLPNAKLPPSKDKEEPGGPYLTLASSDRQGDLQGECEDDLRDLCSFFLDPQYAALLDRLHPR
jgi:tetratricopeptide (TPR) repeat protein